MKRLKTIFFTYIFLILQISNAFCSDTISCKYFPLRIGNTFYYKTKRLYPPPYDSFYNVSKILDTIWLNSKKYFLVNNFMYQGHFVDYKIRYDSANGNLYRYDSSSSQCGFERKLYRLSISVGDTIGSYCGWPFFGQGATFTCNGVGKSYLFGDSVFYKQFLYYWSQSYGWDIYYTNFSINYGMSYMYSQSGGITYSWSNKTYLIGAKINGIVYGDTSLTFINKTSLTIPTGYFLYQNYPNPFNPVTKIKFDIPSEGKRLKEKANLVIYNMLGKEIQTLVNEQLQPGSYEVTFDARQPGLGSNLPSGVYFYQLRAGDYVETRKMLLIK